MTFHRVVIALVALLSALLIPLWSLAAPPEYTLASGDKLQVTVYGRPDLSGPFEIRASGSISMPLLGEVPAIGLTLHDLEESIAEKFRGIFADPPFVNVEIETYRPFFVLGDVAQPGAYPYQHGMTVLKAVALAGGHGRRDEVGNEARASWQERERIHLLFQSYLVDLAREARLVAERDALEIVRFPEELSNLRDNPRAAEILENELSIFRIRREAFEDRLDAAQKEQERRLQLVAELRGTNAALVEKQTLVEEQLQYLEQGASRGIVRRLDMLRTQLLAAEAERQAHQNAVSISTAELAVIQVQQNLAEFRRQWYQDIAAELGTVQHRLSQTELQLRPFAAQIDVMYGAEVRDFMHVESSQSIKYYIQRAGESDSEEIEVGGDEWVFPGDVVRILAPEPMNWSPRSSGLQGLPPK